MNIGQLLRSVMGEVQAAQGKTLELKAGQVVRGIVLQMLSDQDALMNIGGVQVRARLEASLTPGQTAFLQVQPESTGGQVVLKPLQSSELPIAEPSLPEILKAFGLKDTLGNRLALQELHSGQAPVNRETVQAYAKAVEQVPEGAAEPEWRQAALLAVKRGLPATADTVGSLHRALFGSPLDQSLQSFAKTAVAALQADASGTARLPVPVRGLPEPPRLMLSRASWRDSWQEQPPGLRRLCSRPARASPPAGRPLLLAAAKKAPPPERGRSSSTAPHHRRRCGLLPLRCRAAQRLRPHAQAAASPRPRQSRSRPGGSAGS